MSLYVCMYLCMYVCMYVMHRGVLGTIKSFVHALGTDSQMTEPTINSSLCVFIEQGNNSDLQKMVLQFTISFVPSMVYIYMVYTLHYKAKVLVHSFNMHFTIN